MPSKTASVKEYLAELPEDRRQALEAVRKVIRKNLGKGYKEGMQYGMIGYFVPHSVYPPGYHCNPKEPLPFAGLASQKNHMSLYLMCNYSMEEHREWFERAWKKTGTKLDMGKSCIRFKTLDDLPLEVIGEAVRRVPVQDFIEHYERAIKGASGGKRAASKKKASKKKTARKKSSKKSSKKTASKKKSKKATGKRTAKKSTSRRRT